MASSKYKSISISIENEKHRLLKDQARRQRKPGEQASVSKVLRGLVDRYLIDTDEYIPILLKVPIDLRDNEAALKKWLTVRFDAILEKLGENGRENNSCK